MNIILSILEPVFLRGQIRIELIKICTVTSFFKVLWILHIFLFSVKREKCFPHPLEKTFFEEFKGGCNAPENPEGAGK